MADTTERHLEAAVSVIGGRWKPLILLHLKGGPLRYSGLKQRVPQMSAPAFIRQLKDLEADGVVRRHDYDERPPRVDYSLTDYGRTLMPLLDGMAAWGERHLRRSRFDQDNG